MKAKLRKESDGNYMLTLNNPKECPYSLPLLSKQNCDEIFWGLYDTEIEVEIEMRNSRTGNIVKHDSDLEWDEDGLCDRAIPKLDSTGCLILKKI
jgi:hypothetical protein